MSFRCLNMMTGATRRAAWFTALALVILVFSADCAFAMPKRLILELDGISYRDMLALQAGVTYKDVKGREFHRQAFTNGYFTASRNISTFPSTSDVAWTDIFGDRPLPGYQRTYFSEAENRRISINSMMTSMEHERQVQWQVESGFRRALAYVYPLSSFNYELRQMAETFLHYRGASENYYVYVRSTDDAQHMSGDIFAMLSLLNDKLEELRAQYKTATGHDLEILIISDHGHNKAGAGKRVEVAAFLKKSGYRVADTITNPRDVVLPTCGIESWVEVHNAPRETEKLSQLLWQLEGVDLLMARLPDATNQFLVLNSKGDSAHIDWHPANNSFRYSTVNGDPINYLPVVEALKKKGETDADGFATADDWMAATMTNRYPLAPERIVQGLTSITLNPATILLSLSNGYVNAGWLVKKSSQLMILGGTHGGLDDLNSDGMILSNFTPTKDTSTARVAALFDDFPGLENYRENGNGAEWVTGREQALARVPRGPVDTASMTLPPDAIYLRVWSSAFHTDGDLPPLELTLRAKPRFSSARMHVWEPDPFELRAQRYTLRSPLPFAKPNAYERLYPLPTDWNLKTGCDYTISGRLAEPTGSLSVFKFMFRTDAQGWPVAY